MTTPSDTTTSSATRPMPDWMKGTMLAGFIVFLCWGGAISYWRTTRSAPGSAELALYLLGLPALLVLALFAGRRLLKLREAAPAAPAPAPSTPVRQAQAAPAQAAPLAILAAALRSAHGASPDELSAAIAAGRARADLDPELVDDDGFPVMSVRSPDAVDEALRDEISEWLAHNGMPDLPFSDEQWRALVLGTAVVEELATQAGAQLMAGDGDPPMLRLLPLLPADWLETHRNAAAIWFEHAAARCGWPIEHIILAALDAIDLRTATPAVVLGHLAHEAATRDARMTALVMACASHIGDDTVARWSADGSLFTSKHPQGRIPGEGAAGLLLADLPQARAIAGLQYALLEPVQEARREVSADEARRADAAALCKAAEHALKNAAAGENTVVKVVADTGHRSSRMLELMSFVVSAMPQLDESADVLRVGEACGTCGTVPFLTGLAVAFHHVSQDEECAMFVGNEELHRRYAILIHP